MAKNVIEKIFIKIVLFTNNERLKIKSEIKKWDMPQFYQFLRVRPTLNYNLLNKESFKIMRKKESSRHIPKSKQLFKCYSKVISTFLAFGLYVSLSGSSIIPMAFVFTLAMSAPQS